MTADHRDDELNFDDFEDFVIEDLDQAEAAGDQAPGEDIDDLDFDMALAEGAPGSPSSGSTDATSEEDDVLFSGHEPVEASETFDDRRTFSEDGDGEWAGAAIDPEDLGMTGLGDEDEDRDVDDPLTADPDTFDEDEEVELIDDDHGFDETRPVKKPAAAEEEAVAADDVEEQEQVRAAMAAVGLDPAGPDLGEGWESVELATSRGDSEPEDDWAPVEGEVSLDDEESFATSGDEEEDPIYGPQAEDEPEYEYGPDEDWSEYEEEYVDEAPEPAGVAVVAPRKRVGLKIFSGLAALLLLGSGALVVWKPELLGLERSLPVVDRVAIARPTSALEVPPPPPGPVATTDPVTDPGTDPETDPGTDPGTDPVAVTDPVTDPGTDPETDPGTDPGTDPVAVTDPETDPGTDPGTDPVAVTDPETDPQTDPGTDPGTDPVAIADPQPIDPEDPKRYATDPEVAPGSAPYGDDLLVTPYRSERADRLEGVEVDLVAGAKAFAQLHNGNFFVGSVKSAREGVITLMVDKGEVSLARADLAMLTPLASSEFQAFKKAENGFIRLTNNNRLRGTILETLEGNHIVLEMKANRVLIPRTEVEEIGERVQTDVQFDEKNDEAWLRQILEREMRAREERQREEEKGPEVRVDLGSPAAEPGK